MSERTIGAIRDEVELLALLGEPSDLVRAKVSDRLTDPYGAARYARREGFC